MAHRPLIPLELCYICYPFFIRSGCIKITLQDIFCRSLRCRFLVFLWLLTDNRMDANRLHDPVDSVLAVAGSVEPVNPRSHTTVAENVVILLVILTDQLCQHQIFLLCLWNRTAQPLVIGCFCNSQLLTHPADAPTLFRMEELNGKVFRFKTNPAQPHILSNSFTFFNSSTNISCSSSCRFRRKFSRRRRSSSSTSASLLR